MELENVLLVISLVKDVQQQQLINARSVLMDTVYLGLLQINAIYAIQIV